MEKTLQVLNDLERDGAIGRYAIGGAVGAIFYVEPFATFDLDIFVVLPTQGILTTLEPLYAALRQHGYLPENECVTIEGVPVRFLPAFNPLIEEALSAAPEVTLGDTLTRVMSAEHLAAIMVQTGRPKDRQRLTTFLEQADIDLSELTTILSRHSLTARFDQWTLPPELLNRLFTAKADRRRELARADFAEKIRMLIRLQEMAAAIAKTRGKILRPWPMAGIDSQHSN